MKRWFLITILAAAIAACPATARAVSTAGVARNVPYVIGFRLWSSMQQPFVGELRLNFNNGVISGRYTDTSVRPGSPFANRQDVPVSGGVNDGKLMLVIGSVSFHGTMRDEWMSGSATIGGRLYVFEAEQGSIRR